MYVEQRDSTHHPLFDEKIRESLKIRILLFGPENKKEKKKTKNTNGAEGSGGNAREIGPRTYIMHGFAFCCVK